jgi:hypothetical protein
MDYPLMGVQNTKQIRLVQKCTVKHLYTRHFGVCAVNAYPFTVFKRSNRPYFFVSYKDASGKFLSPVSTKKKHRKRGHAGSL